MKSAKPFCDKIRKGLNAYYDDDLSLFMRRVVQKHLSTCDGCRREYALLQTTIETIRHRPAPDVPPRLLKKIIRQFTDPGQGGDPVPREFRGRGWLDGLQRT